LIVPYGRKSSSWALKRSFGRISLASRGKKRLSNRARDHQPSVVAIEKGKTLSEGCSGDFSEIFGVHMRVLFWSQVENRRGGKEKNLMEPSKTVRQYDWGKTAGEKTRIDDWGVLKTAIAKKRLRLARSRKQSLRDRRENRDPGERRKL